MIISFVRRVSSGVLRAAALSAAVALPAALSAQAFEGSITMRMTAGGPNGGVQDIEYLARAGNVRINLNTPGGALAILSLATEQKVFLMMDAQKSYSEISSADQNQLATATEATSTAYAGRAPRASERSAPSRRTGRSENRSPSSKSRSTRALFVAAHALPRLRGAK